MTSNIHPISFVLPLSISVPPINIHELANEITYTDPELFRRIAQDDEGAFRLLYERYVSRIHVYLTRTTNDSELAKEITQELFLDLWVGRKRLSQVDSPNSYIYKIASNIAARQLKKLGTERLVLSLAKTETHIPFQEDEFNTFSAKQLNIEIERAIAELPPQQRDIFRLARQQGLSRNEIAERLGISPSTVKNHLTKAISVLQDKLKDRTGILIPAILFFGIH